VKFGIEGRVYEYDGTITVEDAMFIFDKSHVGIVKFNTALLLEGNPHVIAAWFFILKRRAGEAVRWDDMLKLDVRTFTVTHDEPAEGETPEAAPETPDPTSRSGRTRKAGTSRTT
jgi:hypothetical protein